MGEHAILSASGSKKWLNCPLSITLEKEFENEESVFAKEGTVAHSLGELKLKLELNILDFKSFEKERKELLIDYSDEEINNFEKYTEKYKDFVLEKYNIASENYKNVDLLIEKRLDYSKYAKDGFGTGDALIFDGENIEIIDLKYGKGVKVNAFKNSQLMLYGLGALELYDDLFDINKITLTIFQPRINNISSYTISKDELIKWGVEIVKPSAEKAFYGKGECVEGKHCDEGFCRARPLCKAYSQRYTDIPKYSSKNMSLFSEDELLEIWDIANSYPRWAKLVKNYVLGKLLKGDELKGFKLSENKSPRAFVDDDTVKNILKDVGLDKSKYIKESLAPITEIEKNLGKEEFEELLGNYVHRPKRNPSVFIDKDI